MVGVERLMESLLPPQFLLRDSLTQNLSLTPSKESQPFPN
jgi:hypothetical protein